MTLDARPTDTELAEAARRGITVRALRAEAARARVEQEARDADRLEKDEQREVRKVFLAFGARVYWLSQARRTGQTAGLPDLFVIFPGRVAFWWETKRQVGGRLSAPQAEFRALCNEARVLACVGGRREAEDLLLTLGIATRSDAGTLEPVRSMGA